MKKLNQLVIIEADDSLPPLLSCYQHLLQSYSELSVHVLTMNSGVTIDYTLPPQLVLLHTNLTGTEDLRRYAEVQSQLPYSGIVVISRRHDEELSLMVLEAGAEDHIPEEAFTEKYLQKAVLISIQHYHNKRGLANSREQLLACIQNTPNVAVQWYNSKAEVLFWNKASEHIFGWTAEEASGKTLDQLFHTPGDEELWINKLHYVQNSHQPMPPREWMYTNRNGGKSWCISTLFPIPSFNSEACFVCMDVDITERKRIEEALQESEERYAALFNRASDAIFINNVEGRFLDMNQRACELLNYSKEQLLGMSLTDIYSSEELAQQPVMWRKLLNGERTQLERNMLKSDGKDIPVEITAQMFATGRIMAIVRDITNRKKIEEALVQSEVKYRLLVEQLADAIAIFDEEGTILDVNTSASQMLQYSKAELQQMTLADVLLPEERSTNPVEFTVLKSGASTIKQRKMRRRDGTVLETEVHSKQLYDGMFLSSVRDLTERLQGQVQLEKEKQLSDSIINSLPGLFYLFKKDGTYLRWNKQQEIVSGYTAEEITLMGPLDFIAPEDKEAVADAIEKTFATGQSGLEAQLQKKKGRKIPYYFTGIAVSYAGTECLLGTGIDLSAIKGLELELSQQKVAGQKRVMQAMIDAEEKEKEKLGLELHDNINQILSVVRMYLVILNSGQVPQGVTLTQTIELLNTAMSEIRNLSHQLAASYNFEVGLTEALDDMLKKIGAARDFSIDLTTAPDLNKHTTSHQKLAIYRIVQEQLNNIIKYARASKVSVQVAVTDHDIVLQVADNGKGFDPLKVEKGLGLNTITNRAEALEGKAAIHSGSGQGTRLEVVLPLVNAEV